MEKDGRTKVLISVFSSDNNIYFLDPLLNDLNSQILELEKYYFFSVYVIDFSDTEDKALDYITEYRKRENHLPVTLVWRKNQGFCQNFNMMSTVAKVGSFNYYICLNDDIRLHDTFLKNIIDRFYATKNVGFIGGTSQKGGWLENPENMLIPKPFDKLVELNSLTRLHWEYSACGFPVDVLKLVGEMDCLFSPKLGLVSDNDYLYRIRLHGLKTYRDHNVTFWHSKARSQSLLRDPWGSDPEMQRAKYYMKLKWNYGMDDNKEKIFERPFNGKDTVVITNDILHIVGDGVYNLKNRKKIKECI